MSKWTYKGKPITEVPEGMHGFVYRVTWKCEEPYLKNNICYYIGSKSFFSNTNAKISKKRSEELYTGKGRKPTRERKTKESTWRTYKTSSKSVQALVKEKGEDFFKWEILSFSTTKTNLSYDENKYILCNDCLKDSSCWNAWILARIHKKNVNG